MVQMDPEAGGPAGAPPQRRAFPRVPRRAKARMEFAEQRFFLSEWAVNLSPGGMFVRSEAPMSAGQRFQFEASLTPKGPRFEGVGEVMWVRTEWEGNARPPGFAVRFLQLEEDGKAMMTRLAAVFLERGVGAMQEELQAMAAAGHRRRRDDENTDETHAVEEATEPLADTAVIEAPWAVGLAAEVDAAVDREVGTIDAAAPPGELTVNAPRPVETGADKPGEKPASGGAAPVPGRRRVWWVGVLALAVLGGGYFVMRSAQPGRVARADRPDEHPADAAVLLPSTPATAAVAAPASAGTLPQPTTFAGLEEVKTEARGDELWVVLTLDGELPAQALEHWRPPEDPPREVIQLSGARRGYEPALIPVSSPLLAQIRVGFHPSDPAGNESGAVDAATQDGGEAGDLRVLLDLASAAVVASPPAYEGRSVRVRLSRAETAPASGP